MDLILLKPLSILETKCVDVVSVTLQTLCSKLKGYVLNADVITIMKKISDHKWSAGLTDNKLLQVVQICKKISQSKYGTYSGSKSASRVHSRKSAIWKRDKLAVRLFWYLWYALL